MPHRFASYLRVSSNRQGRNDFGLEAPRAAVAAHLAGGAWTLLDEVSADTAPGAGRNMPSNSFLAK